MAYTDILYEVSDRIATITFNRPEKLNAAANHTHDEFVDALERADNDDTVRVVIITGAGRAFCSGTDLSSGSKWSGRSGDPATGEGVPADYAAKGPLRIYDMKKPVIGAINGVAAGFGASVLCSMDMRIAAEEARIAFIYARRGICNESCSSFFLPRLVGMARAQEWVATGRMLPAAELLAAGFVREVVAGAELLPRARALAREIVDNTAPAAVAVSRHLMWRNLGVTHPAEASQYETRGLTGLMSLDDPGEGRNAFAEKRLPKFTSRPSKDVGFIERWWKKNNG